MKVKENKKAPLFKLSGTNNVKFDSKKIKGNIIFSQETEFGLLVIGSSQNNTYLRDIPFLIDLGGHGKSKSRFKENISNSSSLDFRKLSLNLLLFLLSDNL